MAGYVRFLFAIMICIANMIIYALKVNISTVIMGMVKSKQPYDNGTTNLACPALEADSAKRDEIDGPYDWSTTEQGFVVSIYFAGYLIGMFPTGYFSDRFNAKWVILICVFCNGLFTLLVPTAAQYLPALYVLRFLTGLVSSANLPVVGVLVGNWVVYEEKSMWVGIIYAGTSLGTVISILSSGLIMKDISWEAVFYIHGAIPIIWCVVFFVFFAESPENQKYISESERRKLVTSYGHRSPGSANQKIPWKAMFKSVPFWALLWTNTFGNFCWYFLLTQLPLYMNKMLRYNVKSNAMLSCLPYLVNAVTNPLLGKFLDAGRTKGYWTQTTARKTAVGISCIPPSIFLIAIMYVECNRLVATVLLCLSIVICGAIFVGHLCNQNDLAPNYAGILMGITNTPGTISAFILPALVGVLTEQGHTFERWSYVFWINVAAQLSAFLVFLFFGSAKIQDWNYPDGIPPSDRITMEERKDSNGTAKPEVAALMT